MKKRLIILLVVSSYLLFTYMLLSTEDVGAHHGSPSIYEIVMHHLTDHPIAKIAPKKPHGSHDAHGETKQADVNPVLKTLISINNFIAVDANNFIQNKSKSVNESLGMKIDNKDDNTKVLGIFDLRITKWVIVLWIAAFMMLFIFFPLSRKIKKDSMGSKSRWVNFWESMIGFVHDDIVEPNFDHEYINKAMPYFLTVFFFMFFANYIGLIPGSATSTGNLAVTGGMAMFTLLGMIVVGMVRQGPLWIIKGIVPGGIPLPLFPLLWVIELAGLLIKPFALMVRLFANMTAGHVVIIIFLYLVIMFQSCYVGIGSVVGSLMIFMLELLVCLIQAYIFTSLSAMFIGASMHSH